MHTSIKKTYVVYPIPGETNLHGWSMKYENMKHVVNLYNDKHNIDRHYLEYLNEYEFVSWETLDTNLKNVVAKAGFIYEKDKVFYCDVEYLKINRFEEIKDSLNDMVITTSKSGTVINGIADITSIDKLTIEPKGKILSIQQLAINKIQKVKSILKEWNSKINTK